jgi:hypothetical protein
MPYVGGLDRYLEICREVTATNYDGFVFGRREDVPAGVAAAAASPAAA